MPYYVFKIQSAEMVMIKQLELVETFEKFKQAKIFARDLRANQEETDVADVKVMFADNQLAAEEMLMEKRDKPITMEHEK